MSLHDNTIQELLALSAGRLGFKRIADTNVHTAGAGSHTDVAEFIGLYSAGATQATFGAGCVAAVGDAPSATDQLPEGFMLPCRLTSVQLAGGVAYALYHYNG